jgi:DNA invertase Pin-like site-specific DNA recombinase
MEFAMAKAKRAAIYLRVSTDEQTTQNQQPEVAAVAAHHDQTRILKE